MVTRIALATLVAGVIALPAPASAQSACAPRVDIVEKLKEKYGEDQRGLGLGGKKSVIELWSSDKTGTWTIVMTRPNGVTCIVAAGDTWMEAPPVPEPEI